MSRRCSCRRRRTGGSLGGPSVPIGRRRKRRKGHRPGSARGLAAGSVALVHGDAAEVALELIPRIDDRCHPIADARVQPAARGDQQRKAGADVLVTEADVAFFVELESSSWVSLLSKD